jgi:hypothetical protein
VGKKQVQTTTKEKKKISVTNARYVDYFGFNFMAECFENCTLLLHKTSAQVSIGVKQLYILN